MSEATNISLSPRPSTTGLPLRAATIRSGCLLSSTTMPYVPTTEVSAWRTASSRSSAALAAIRWASTSLSVSDTNVSPSAISLARSSSAFSMMPLCTTRSARRRAGGR